MVYRCQQHIRGPLLDRTEIHLVVPHMVYADLVNLQKSEPSNAIRARVEAARCRQQAQFAAVVVRAAHSLQGCAAPTVRRIA